ncbi:MAG: extracellular solute-binding protein, partial [Proteobacteria bacterium]|nr:extracellular solute-binding protein [Pseudomonadota bacterium]
IGSLALIFDPANMEKLAACGVHFLDAPNEMIPAALAYIGEDPNSHDPEVIAKTEAVLAAVQPWVQKYHSSEYINGLANGAICVAFGWSGDVLQARDRADEADNDVEIAYNAPSEGALMWFDQMAIPVDAPNPDAAHIFLNFILDAQNIADASNYVYYANGNLASLELLDPRIANDPAAYPPMEDREGWQAGRIYGPKLERLRSRTWSRVKTGL